MNTNIDRFMELRPKLKELCAPVKVGESKTVECPECGNDLILIRVTEQIGGICKTDNCLKFVSSSL